MSKLVIAEKPMLARDIARAITGKEVSESARLPISGNGYTVCACAGHLLELVEPDTIDPKWGMPWSLDVLPIEVHDWPKEPAVDKKTGESKKPLIDQIAGLLETCDSVIAAGDPDDEGQLIVDELLDYLGYTGKVERVYVNDNIEKNIVKAFDKLVPNDSCRGAGNAAYARQMADMCFGVNETRLATKRLDGLFTVGRVQTPTLGLVVKRDEAIAHHVTRKFYELFASGDSDAGKLTFKYLPGKELLAGEKHVVWLKKDGEKLLWREGDELINGERFFAMEQLCYSDATVQSINRRAIAVLNFYETPEMTLIDHEPNGDSATVLVLALAKIHTRTVTKNDDGTFTIVTDDGTFTDTEVMEMLSSFGYRANHAKYTHALAVVARFPPFDHLAYSEAERDKKTPEVYQ